MEIGFNNIYMTCYESIMPSMFTRRELALGTVSLTGDRVQGNDSKHCAYST